MAKFNINTFNPIYPESNDKKGEIQLLVIREPEQVGENYTEEMRLDLLPCFSRSTDTNLRTTPVGRQTMFRTVFTDENDILWVQNYGDPSFLNTGGVVSANLGFFDFVSYNVRKYEDFLNGFFSDNGILTSILITKIHVIGSNIQFIQHTGNSAIFLHTYDVIFYGQESPNPYDQPEPAPECIPYNYVQSVIYNQNPLKVTPTVGLAGEMYATLLSADPSKGTQAVVWQYRGFSSGNPFIAGETYALRVNADPTPAGTTITLTLFMGSFASSPYGITIVLTDAGITDQYFSIVCNPDTPPTGTNTSSLRVNAAAQTPQTPTSGSNFNVNIEFQFYTNTCLLT